MASLSDSAGGRAGAELMVAQFHYKVLHAVLAVRAPRPLAAVPAAAASFRRRDRWFHLPLHDPPPPPAADHLAPSSPAEPLVVDIYLSPAGATPAAAGEVVERWTVACEPWPDAAAASGEALAVNKAYKRCITMLRSVYATLRLLPAYRVFRLLCASNQSYNYEMSYRVGSFAAPFSRAEEAAMRARRFAAVETQLGRLAVSVQYLPSLAAFNLEISSLVPSMLIADYVGSPAAEPMRAFPASLTETAGSAFPPPPAPPQRPHSWASPALWPPMPAPAQQPKFSPPPVLYASPTPSPPTFAGGYLQSRLRGETAPVSIPQVAGGRSPVHNRNMSDPNRGFMLPPPSPRSVRAETAAAAAAATSSQGSPSESSRSFKKAEGLRMADLYANLPAGPKVKDSRDESGRFSGVLSSCGSPRLGFSRSSSRLSMQDDLDDADYPFAVDDVDTPDSQAGKGISPRYIPRGQDLPPGRSSDGKDAGDQAGSSSHKSQDAAVGYLVHLLRTARPLRDPGYSSQTSRAESSEVGTTSSFMSRRTSDALEELQSFKEIRESLLSGSRAKLQESLEKP